MHTVCKKNKCTGCMACKDVCGKNAIRIVDSLDSYNACIDDKLCVGCASCQKVCQVNNPPKLQKPIRWVQGWANDINIRQAGSSGGFATAIAKGFIRNGGIVCSCCFEKGKFVFRFADTEKELTKFTGSKYVKSDLSGIFKEIKQHLQYKQKVLFIGLPCQIAALGKLIGSQDKEYLYTIDLICHGTPSPILLDRYLRQYGITLQQMSDIRFRKKGKFQINDGKKGFVPDGAWDQYTIAFLNMLSYTENCYSCNYACLERISDMTLGDSWGSEIDSTGGKSGISLALIQNEHGLELLELGDLHIESVDLDTAVANNHQLHHPSICPKGRTLFFDGLKNNRNFNMLVFRALPKCSFKQTVKAVLIKTGLFKPTNF